VYFLSFMIKFIGKGLWVLSISHRSLLFGVNKIESLYWVTGSCHSVQVFIVDQYQFQNCGDQ
jgi:hypothetical protein